MAGKIDARSRAFSDLVTTNPNDYFDPRTVVNPPTTSSTSSYSSVYPPHPSTPLKLQKSLLKSVNAMKPYSGVGSVEVMIRGEIQKKSSAGSILADGEDDAEKIKTQMEVSAELLEGEEAMADLGNKNTMRICRICSREFPSGRALGGHMRVHGASQLIMPEINVNLKSGYSCREDGGTCMKNKSDNLGRQSEHNLMMNQKDELFTEMIRKHRINRISYVSPRNPQLMSSAEEENDDQRQIVSFLNQDLAMEGEEEVEDASVAEFASRDMVSFSSSQYTASEDMNLGSHGDGGLQKQKINGESADLINGKKRACNPNLYELRRNPKPNLRFIRSTPLNSDQQLMRKSANCMINSAALASSSSSINSSASVPAPATAQKIQLKRSNSNSSSAISASSSPSPSPEPVSNGAKPHACTECGKSFCSWKALFGHMRCHPEREWRGINRPSDQQNHQHKRRRMRTVLNSFKSSLHRARSIGRSAGNSSSSAIIDAAGRHSHSYSHVTQSFKDGAQTVNRGDLTNSFSAGSTGEEASFVNEDKDAIKTSSLSELISSHHAEYQAAEHKQAPAAEAEEARINCSGRKKMNTSVSNSLLHIKRRRTMAMVELAPKGEKNNADHGYGGAMVEPAEEEEEEEIEENRSRSSAPNVSANISFSDINIKAHGYGGNHKVSPSTGQKSRKNSGGKTAFFARNSSSCSSTHENHQAAGFSNKERSSSMQMSDNDDGKDDESYTVSDFWSPCWPIRCKRRSNLRGRHSSEYRHNCNQARTDSSNNNTANHHKFPADADDGKGDGEEDGQLMMEVEMQEDVDMANCLVLLSGSGISKSCSTAVICRPADAGANQGGTRKKGRRRRRKGRRKARRSVLNSIAATMANDGDGDDGDGDGDGKMDDSNDLCAVDAKIEDNGYGEQELRALDMAAVKKPYHCATCNRSFTSHQALGGHRASHRRTRGCYAAAQSLLHKDDHDLPPPNLSRIDHHQNAIAADLGRIHPSDDPSPHHHHHADHASSCSAIESKSKKESKKLAIAHSDLLAIAHSDPLAIAHSDHIQSVHGQLITTTSSSAATDCGVKKKIVAHQAMDSDSCYRRGGGHECSVCHRIFPSGQALGGHKRCHWITTTHNIINLNHGDGEDDNDQKLFSTNLSELDESHEHHRISANLDSDSIPIATANYTEFAHSNDPNYHCSNNYSIQADHGIRYFQNSFDNQEGLMQSAATNYPSSTNYHSSNVFTADDQLLRSRSVNSKNDEDTSILLLDLNLPAPVDYNHMKEMNQSNYIMNMQKDYTMNVQEDEDSDHASREQFMPLQFCVARDSSSSSSSSSCLFGLISH